MQLRCHTRALRHVGATAHVRKRKIADIMTSGCGDETLGPTRILIGAVTFIELFTCLFIYCCLRM